MLGHITRDEDEQRHVEDIDQSHHGVIDEVHVIQPRNDVTHHHQDDQHALEGIDARVSCHGSQSIICNSTASW